MDGLQPFLKSLFSLIGNVHVYSNGRMRYTYHQRQDRREHQGDVSWSKAEEEIKMFQNMHRSVPVKWYFAILFMPIWVCSLFPLLIQKCRRVLGFWFLVNCGFQKGSFHCYLCVGVRFLPNAKVTALLCFVMHCADCLWKCVFFHQYIWCPSVAYGNLQTEK